MPASSSSSCSRVTWPAENAAIRPIGTDSSIRSRSVPSAESAVPNGEALLSIVRIVCDATGSANSSPSVESRVKGCVGSSPATVTVVDSRRSRLEAPTDTAYSPDSTAQRPAAVFQYARSLRLTRISTTRCSPGSTGTELKPASQRGGRPTLDPGSPA